mmetsp:Transcript_12297/g.23896  ORF Transcript_12297/g.23896 Transcript_12297/m.23896 type:complete len:523 (+) Transcript_12297:114-1682(+)|eukprot:CAMPEP_0171514494 /NCGR_PEP_ID=MMETSP0959-20130129/2878_1 /TAXON_ID=87120 /ORGANISM="Aurantiochytrium limacinum, Strain ATCCMYA-1381" /LENGTH=522 /DNA_ID=CAMNT_0012052831 /DNA_START=174 /DNA_END=1742 /DNA_ORIENTATION=+
MAVRNSYFTWRTPRSLRLGLAALWLILAFALAASFIVLHATLAEDRYNLDLLRSPALRHETVDSLLRRGFVSSPELKSRYEQQRSADVGLQQKSKQGDSRDQYSQQNFHRTEDEDYPELHVIYNVGCGGHSSYRFQLIQSLTLDYSWAKHRQPGRLTRIVSGCGEDPVKRKAMSQTSIEDPEALARFDTWFTEANDTVNGVKYVMFNRPTALIKYFATQKTSESAIYAVLDPDFVFLHKIPDDVIRKVRPGKPVAAFYALGSKWVEWGQSICRGEPQYTDAVCDRFDRGTRIRSASIYEGGAPYLMVKSDWQRLLPTWISVMPPTHKFYSGIESDMYAYMIAFVLLDMEHTLEKNLMRTCMANSRQQVDDGTTFIHYCQRYHVQETRGEAYNVNNASEFLPSNKYNPETSKYLYVFSKYWMQAIEPQKWILECESPLLILPPKLPESHFYSLNSPSLQRKDYRVLNELVPAVNDAISAYKRKICPAQGKTPNFQREMILHESHRHTKHLLNSIIPLSAQSEE